MTLAFRSEVPPDNSISEMRLFATLLGLSEKVLPEIIQQHGAAWGIALYKHQTTVIVQAMGGCLDNPSPQR
jgi:hypothetical protein